MLLAYVLICFWETNPNKIHPTYFTLQTSTFSIIFLHKNWFSLCHRDNISTLNICLCKHVCRYSINIKICIQYWICTHDVYICRARLWVLVYLGWVYVTYCWIYIGVCKRVCVGLVSLHEKYKKLSKSIVKINPISFKWNWCQGEMSLTHPLPLDSCCCGVAWTLYANSIIR